MSRNIVCLHIYIFLCISYVANSEKQVVDTTHGKLSGKVLKTLYKNVEYFGFMGIPYAKPPIGELRFLPPQPLEPWENVLTATKEKKACIQFNSDIKKDKSIGVYGIEDCLYLDIFTPALDNAKRDVIMFLYNDHFITSYNKSKDYQPDFFIEEDVVFVTISHRLSAFGFLSLEDEMLWGNSGLKDIVQGLEWIRDNIEKFGGDVDKITLMGANGGAAAVDLLIHSTKKDLFKSAILHSSSSWASAYLQEGTRERAFKLARLFERNPTNSEYVLKDLNQIPAQNITSKDLHASPDDYFKETQRSVCSFGPVVEKDPNGLIVDYPENTTEINKPILIGFNSKEGLEQSLHYLLEPRYMSFLKKDFPFLLPIRLNFRFDPLRDAFYDAVDEIKDFYFKKGIKVSTVTDYVTYIGDVVNSYPVDYAARMYANISKAPLYYYYFDYVGEFNENKNELNKLSALEDIIEGAALGDELCYLLKCPDLKETYIRHDKDLTDEREIQIKIVRMWTNFAKYGNPTPADDSIVGNVKWPTYDSVNKQYLRIGKPMEIKRDVNKIRFQFWDQFFERWAQRAVNGVITDSPNIKKDEL